ncbi:MAG: helix-turn-helix domain-containing protein [Bacteroidales bacterium]|nr:helix-turn-helix domain-containing protein [Bacteroidales bacterium]
MIPTTNIPLTLINVGLACHQGDWNWRNVRSPFARIYYVTEGRAQVILPDKTLELFPNHLYLIPPFVTHHYVCNGRFSHYYVHFFEQKEISQQGVFDEWELPNETEAQSDDLSMVKHLCQLLPRFQLSNSNPETYDNRVTLANVLQEVENLLLYERMEAQGILQILLSRFLRHAQQRMFTHDRRVQNAILYIRQHIHQKIELDTLAAETCVSKDHLIRIFKQVTGETPSNYITRQKLEKAELMLATTRVPVKNIASELGYDDTSYFIRIFRKHSCMTPQEYRNMRQ